LPTEFLHRLGKNKAPTKGEVYGTPQTVFPNAFSRLISGSKKCHKSASLFIILARQFVLADEAAVGPGRIDRKMCDGGWWMVEVRAGETFGLCRRAMSEMQSETAFGSAFS
jgi:hypothetical protein